MSELRALAPLSYETRLLPARDLGPKGELKWIPIAQIMIDPAYQRALGLAGKRNIRQIVEHFNWALFSPVVVSRRGPELYAAIDGQHRAIAALTHAGIKEVPCWVIEAARAMEARAFAVINGQVTALNPLHVFRAKIVAGDERAARIGEAARAAGVTIMERPTGAAQLKHGQTQAPTAIGDALERFGRDITVLALRCVTETGEHPGMLRAVVIAAFAELLAAAPKWRADRRLLGALSAAGLKALYSAALQRQAEQGGGH